MHDAHAAPLLHRAMSAHLNRDAEIFRLNQRYHDAAGRCACGASILITHRRSHPLPGSACCSGCKSVVILKNK